MESRGRSAEVSLWRDLNFLFQSTYFCGWAETGEWPLFSTDPLYELDYSKYLNWASICLFTSDLFHLAWYLQGLFTCLKGEQCSSAYIHLLVFIHPSLDEYLGYSYCLAIVNNAVMNTSVQTSIQVPAFHSFGKYVQKWNFWIIWQFCAPLFEELL